MADQTFNIAFACEIQTVKGTAVVPAAWSTTDVTEAAGAVLGDRDSGDANSGISIPSFDRVSRALADAGLTKTGSSFIRLDTSGLAITIQAKGNGVVSTPTAGQAKPAHGIDVLWRASGFAGANGTAPLYNYIPTDTEEYMTVGFWLGDNLFVLQDCIATPSIKPEPGNVALVTFTIEVGSHDPATQHTAGVTFPTFDYGNQLDTSAPIVQAADSTFGTARDFSDMEITVNRETEEVKASNSPTGLSKRQTARTVAVTGNLYVDSTDGDQDYQNVIGDAPDVNLTFHIGELAAPTEPLLSLSITCYDLQFGAIKLNKLATITIAEISGAQCQGATSGSEFLLVYG